MRDGDLQNLVFDLVDRYLSGALGGVSYHERHGIVTSYDPEKYLAKVTLMPEGQETGWLPIETGHIGESYGIAVGLQPGDGKQRGDQVIVRFQEGDLESGKIVQRVHSDDQTPPTVQSGEIVIWSRFQNSDGGPDSGQGGQGGTGQKIYLKNDGSISWTDGNGATQTFDGKGDVALVAKKWNVTASDVIDIEGQTTILVNGTQTVTVKSAADVQVIPGDGHFVYLGGTGSDGAYDFVLTASGPSINVKARIG